jgi:hypothetical protein
MTNDPNDAPTCPRCGDPSRQDPDWPDRTLLCDECAPDPEPDDGAHYIGPSAAPYHGNDPAHI